MPPKPHAHGRAAGVLAALLIGGFVVAFSARPAIVLSTAGVDDALFMRLGHYIASGYWLGPYNELTLAKGPGFPAFLAFSNVAGLPFPLALALWHAACSAFAAWVAARLTRSRWTGLATLAALLLTPPLYEGELLRVFRDLFYASTCLAFVSAAIALATGCLGRPRLVAVLTGVLGAWVWLTREEGVWLAPALGVLLLARVLGLGVEPGAAPRSPMRRAAPAALAFAIAAALVGTFGLLNWAVYGRFVVNEIKDGAFQSALTALQEASAPFHKEGVPVPAAARARIYAVSPAFASLKEPVLDGPMQPEATKWGCADNPKMCGDFGGGWFFWYMRSSAAARGHHGDPQEAAAFYRRLAAEVRTACRDGRLECRPWPVPLVPPMQAREVPEVARSLGRVVDVMSFGRPVSSFQRDSDLTAPGADDMLAFLNLPGAYDVRRRQMSGWFVGRGDQWFQVRPAAGDVELVRQPSHDLVAHYQDPRLMRQRFSLSVECPRRGACPATFTPDGGPDFPLDLAKLGRGPHAVGAATLHLDDAGDDNTDRLLKARLSRLWLAAETRLSPAYRLLLVVGLAAYAAAAVAAIRRRRATIGLVVCTALLASAAARAVILALIDALSFRASSHAYTLPAILFLVLFSVYALHEAAVLLRGRRRAPAAAPP